MKKTNQKGFTLIELLVVIAIIGLLSTLAVVSLNNARAKSRDAKRIADVKQMQTALELYFNECSAYPSQAAGLLTTASEAVSGGCQTNGTNPTTFGQFMSAIPVAPTPADNGCDTAGAGGTDANPYTYQSCNSTGGTCDATQIASYSIQYCLGEQTGAISAGVHNATPAGMD